jgi:hypothetical protein
MRYDNVELSLRDFRNLPLALIIISAQSTYSCQIKKNDFPKIHQSNNVCIVF